MTKPNHDALAFRPADNACPIRIDAPVTCAAFVALKDWLGMPSRQFRDLFQLTPILWGEILNAADNGGTDFPNGPPLIGAAHALVARWVAAHPVLALDPLRRPHPAKLYAALTHALPQPPSLRLLGLLLGRDGSAGCAWCGGGRQRDADPVVHLASALILSGGERGLARRWRAWEGAARREAALRGIASLERAGTWQPSDGRILIPRGRNAHSLASRRHSGRAASAAVRRRAMSGRTAGTGSVLPAAPQQVKAIRQKQDENL